MPYPHLNAHRRPRKGNKFSPEESHWFNMGAMYKPSNTIYLHKCKGKLKCITAVDLKTTLDPQQ